MTDAVREALAQKIEELEAEVDALTDKYHLLSSEMVYEGNSVQHWRQKALAYKECARAIYDLKEITKADTPASVVAAVHALAAHLEFIKDGVMNAPVASGVCCCGDSMENHADPMSCGHIPVDMWDDYKEGLFDQSPTISLARRDTLKKAEALETFAKHCRQLSDNARENGYMQAADAVGDVADEAVQEADRLCRQAEEGEP